MSLSAKTIKKQLAILQPIINGLSLKTIRKAQNKVGELMESRHRDLVMVRRHEFDKFNSAWVIPKDERRHGVILYLHGGGYTCGDLEYALGFGSMLAVQSGVRTFCVGYRLAPENPYPAALEDALEAYQYLLNKGYSPKHITLCGESAGGGLCYSLCLKLKTLNIDLPGGIIAISPWSDLTASGKSYDTNKNIDPSMTSELLEFYADSYTEDRTCPFVSPVFADLSDLSPSLIFVGGDEIMLDDSVLIHEKLRNADCKSKLVIKPDRWHAYLLYGLDEDVDDFSLINKFLNQVMDKENKLRWMRLDNAAKIYPAARRQNWSNVFRLSATLKEPVDKEILQTALDVTVRRFPSIAVRLRRGVFWYYLQQLSKSPDIRDEYSYPLTWMSKHETSKCALRVIVYNRRIAVEIFHSLTDGNGALVFLKSLIAEYILQKYGVYVPAEHGVVGRLEEPDEAELEDSFLKYSADVAASRKENTAWRFRGTPELKGLLNLTCFETPVSEVLNKAHEYGVSVTTFLCSAIMMALQNMQKQCVKDRRKRKPIKVLIPVNLRKLFDSRSLRNFVLYTTPEILPNLGEYSFEEICKVVDTHMGANVTAKQMSMKIATNVNSERVMALRLTPLFIKNFVMKAVYDAVGERKSCLSMSNLGAVKLPDVMTPFVERFDFVLGVQASLPYNCGVLSYGDTLYINFIRNIREPDLEYHFYSVLRDMGIHVSVQSN